MPALRDVQAAFAAALDDERRAGPAARLLAAGPAAAGIAAAQRLQIHRNNYQITLREALAAVYPVVNALVGDGFFAWLAHEYIAAHPSRSGNLHAFGARLPAFVAAFPAAAGLRYLADVAHLEWAWHRAFHAADAGPLDLQALASVAAEQHADLRFQLHPSVSLLSAETPFLDIWQAHQPDPAAATPVDVHGEGQRALVLRAGLEVRVMPASRGEYALLAAVRAGSAFGAACEAALAAQRDVDVSACVERHVGAGTLSGFSTGGDAVARP